MCYLCVLLPTELFGRGDEGISKGGILEPVANVYGLSWIFYADYPAIANLICPEWSHLTPADAVVYTRT